MTRRCANLGLMTLNLLSYLGATPRLAEPPRHFGAGAAVLGRVALGANAWLAAGSVIRADGNDVRAGDDLYLGPRATVHIAHDLYPTLIGARVTVGEYAVLHACEVGDDCVIEERAVVLDGSVLEAGAVLAADSVVFPRTRLAGGAVYAGRPAKEVRRLAPGELERLRERLRARIAAHAAPYPQSDLREPLAPSVFVANTARLRGDVHAASRVNIWYGALLDADGGQIVIGEAANVQDNALLSCGPGGRLEIGAGTTIGHNVRLHGCVIGDRSLIGIGSVLAPGTRVEDDVFVAAGATTTPGQVLKSGNFYGGQPARVLGPLDERKRALIALTIDTYCAYAAELARVQARLAA